MPHAQSILLAEDDADYALIIERALRHAGLEGSLHVLQTRNEVINYMTGHGRYADREHYPIPAVIILAMRLPFLHDFEMLRWVRARHEFDPIHVVILSGIEYEGEGAKALALGADFYFVKPCDFNELVDLAHRLYELSLPHAHSPS